jgi:hypothetical protein
MCGGRFLIAVAFWDHRALFSGHDHTQITPPKAAESILFAGLTGSA